MSLKLKKISVSRVSLGHPQGVEEVSLGCVPSFFPICRRVVSGRQNSTNNPERGGCGVKAEMMMVLDPIECNFEGSQALRMTLL